MYPSIPVPKKMNDDANRIKVQRMGGQNRKFVSFDFISPSRLHNDTESEKGSGAGSLHKSFSFERTTTSVRRGWEKGSSSIKNFGRSLKSPFTRVFAEDFDATGKRVLDPRSKFVTQWNQFFVMSCLVAVFVDPLFFYLPIVDGNNVCIKIQKKLAIVVTVLRTCTDMAYLVHMFLQFWTAFIAPSSRVFGRGELVIDPKLIAKRYMKKDFWLDFLDVIPLPQIVIWVFIPLFKGATADHTFEADCILPVSSQAIPDIPIDSQMVKTTGVVMETAWAGAAYNLLLYMLASHVIVAFWYLLAVERQDTCWRTYCDMQPDNVTCLNSYFDCGSLDNDPGRDTWFSVQSIGSTCTNQTSLAFNYGIYWLAISNGITTNTKFLDKYIYLRHHPGIPIFRYISKPIYMC